MKKIVGIIAAVAMAASVFAADVSAKVVLGSDLFSYQDGAVKALTSVDNKSADYQPYMALSTSSDKAGAAFKVYGGATPTVGKLNIWFKPVDMLKLSFGNVAAGMFGDKFNGYYAEGTFNTDIDNGYAANIAIDAIAIDVVVSPALLNKANKDADMVKGDLTVKAAYNASFGSVAAFAKFGSDWKEIKLAAGYNGNIDALGITANAGIVLNDGYKKAVIDPSVSYAIDALSCALYTPVTLEKDADAKMGLKAKVQYNLDNGMNVYAKFDAGNILASTFDATITGGIAGNIGGAAWKVEPAYTISSKKFAAYFETSLGF